VSSHLTFINKDSKDHSMAKKLYVGGISYNTTQAGLEDAFRQAGTVVSASIIMDKMSGRSKGFGFVEMSTDDEAQAAIDMYNGKELDGRRITVNEARPKEDRPQRSFSTTEEEVDVTNQSHPQKQNPTIRGFCFRWYNLRYGMVPLYPG
jgi:RNA recognition motif-containing protein